MGGGTNVASEAFHTSWSHSSSINLSLVDAAYNNIVDAILTEEQMQEIGSGAMALLRGPYEATRKARKFEEQKQRAKEYASTIKEIAKNLVSAAQSCTRESDSTHRPDKRRSSAKRLCVSIQHVRARAEEICLYLASSEEESQRCDIVNNRSKRRRAKRSKRFNESLNRALTERFAVTSYKKDGQGIYCSVRGLQDTYLVTVTDITSCTCPYYMYRPNNSDQIFKHLIWTYVNVIGLSEDDESIHQVFLNSQELKRILKKTPTEPTNANASVSAPSQSLQDARFSSRMLPQPTAANSTPPTTCATHCSPSIYGASRNLHTAATLPTAMSFSPYLYSGIQGAPVLHSPSSAALSTLPDAIIISNHFHCYKCFEFSRTR